jgi:hypothetical protein
MSANTRKLRRIVGGHQQAGGRVLDLWNGTAIANSDRAGNHCVRPEVAHYRYLEPSRFDMIGGART